PLSRAEIDLRVPRYYRDAMEFARGVTEWSKSLTGHRHVIVCSDGFGGMIEAAKRRAKVAGSKTIGMPIGAFTGEAPNPYIAPDMVFRFHYFFMRKFWFVYLAKALVIFPGGFGTMDELFEVLTLIQTKKPRKTMPIVLFGAEFWNEIVNFNALVKWG